MPLRAVIFDMDGVIVDTMDMHFDAATAVLRRAGADVSREDIMKMDSMRSEETFSRFLSSKPKKEIRALVTEKYRELFSMSNGIKPISGFLDFFFLVKGTYALAVVSSSLRSFVLHIMSCLGISDSFSVLLGGDDILKGKPDPEGYLLAASRLGVKPEECLVTEDSIYGIMSAKAAGMKVVAVTNTYERGFLLDADLVVDSLAELTIEKCEELFHGARHGG